MKERLRKLSQKDFVTRFRVKYKKLLHLNCILLTSTKWLKLKRTKWLTFTGRYSRQLMFSSRIFSSAPETVSIFSNQNQVGYIRCPLYTYSYASLLRAKRIFQFWYGVKRIKTLKSLYARKRARFYDKTNKPYYISRILSLIHAFEHRLDVLVFRMFFFPSIFYAQKFIFNKYICVNTVVETYFNRVLQINSLITLNGAKAKTFIKNYLYYITHRKYQPKYLVLINYLHIEINYKLLCLRIHGIIQNFESVSFLYPFNHRLHVLQSYFDSKF